MQVRLLGALTVEGDHGAVPLGGPRQRAALAVLLLNANEVVSLDRLVDDVWPSVAPPTATTTLQAYLSRLRRVLGPVGIEIVTRKPGYVLQIDRDCIDTCRFEALVEIGRSAAAAGDDESASHRLGEALALWHGPALVDFVFEPFARAEITRLEELRLAALEERIEADLALGRTALVVPELEALIAEHPLRERFRGQLMKALHWSGRRADALRVYRDARDHLAEELGIDPSTELQHLEQAILFQDDAVERVDTTRPGRSNLPVAITSFVGRQRELAELRELIGAHRVVTILGPGGAGKTRLALETAAGLCSSFPSGVRLVELAAARDADGVIAAVANALSVQEDGERPLREAVVAAVVEKHGLLVLDNCEQVVAGVAAFVDEVVHASTGVRILATSRQPLELAGEVAWPIPPLETPPARVASLADALHFDAVRLLVDRARTAVPGLDLSDDDAGPLVSIARRLDGMPLGLELAAGRLRGLSAAEVDVRLDDRFRLLALGSSANVERHRTLEAAVEWSYDLLDAPERLVFDRLSVLAGVFTIDAATAVCSGGDVAEDDVVDLLAGLVAKSLVSRVGVTAGVSRYRLLDTLRSFGHSRLAARGELDAVRENHARYCLARASDAAPHVHDSGCAAAMERFGHERDDFHLALAWLIDHERADEAVALAAALWKFWHRAVHIDGLRWLEAALALPGSADDARAVAMLGAAALAIYDDDHDRALDWANRAAALAEQLGNVSVRAHALVVRAEMRRVTNAHGDSEADARTAAELAASCGADWVRADALRVWLLVAWDRGDIDTAARFGAEALTLWTRCGDVARAAGARVMLGLFAAERGRLDEAAALYEESLDGFRRAGDVDGQAHTTLALARLALARGELAEAEVLAADTVARREEIGDRRGAGQAWTVLAQAGLQNRDFDVALSRVHRAIALLESVGFGGDLAIACLTAAWVEQRQGHIDAARQWYDRWWEQGEAVGAHRLPVRGQCLTALLRIAGGDQAGAREAAERARALAGETHDHRGTAFALETLAAVAIVDGGLTEAAVLLRSADRVRAEHGVVMTPDERVERERLLSAIRPVIDLTATLGDRVRIGLN